MVAAADRYYGESGTSTCSQVSGTVIIKQGVVSDAACHPYAMLAQQQQQ